MSSTFELEGLMPVGAEDQSLLGSYVIEVDWDNDGTFAGSFDDISSDCISWTCRSGRDFPIQLTGRALAGVFEVVVKNTDGKYNSFNSSSDVFGNLVPNRTIRWRSDAPVARTIFTGRIDEIKPNIRRGEAQKATIRAKGVLILLESDVRIAMQTAIATGAALDEILDGISFPAGDRDIDTGQTTMTRYWHDDAVKALTAAREIEATEAGFLRETRDGKIAFEDREHRLQAPHTESQRTYSDAAGSDYGYEAIGQFDPKKLIYNEFRSSVRLFTVGGLAVLWTHPEAKTSGDTAPEILPGQSIDYFASYPNADSATDGVAVDAWTTPVVTTDYTANSAGDGGGSDLTASIGIAVDKLGQTMKITVTNNHASTPARLTFLQARGTPITVSDPVTVSALDTTSRTAFGLRTFPRPDEAKWTPNTEEALGWCQSNLAVYKDPIPVLPVEIPVNRNLYQLTDALTRDISDRVTIVATGSKTNLGINNDFFIEAITHRVSEDRRHTMMIEVSDASKFSDFWVLGTSELGTSTRLFY